MVHDIIAVRKQPRSRWKPESRQKPVLNQTDTPRRPLFQLSYRVVSETYRTLQMPRTEELRKAI